MILNADHYLFTSESVTEGHPDKIADQISDAVLDCLLAQDPRSRVACETLVTTGMAVIAGEITTEAYADLPEIVRSTVREIGYVSSDMGFDANTSRKPGPMGLGQDRAGRCPKNIHGAEHCRRSVGYGPGGRPSAGAKFHFGRLRLCGHEKCHLRYR